MKIYLASSNEGKKREIQQLLPEWNVITPKDEGIEFDPEETGTNFYENSIIKALALHEIVHAPVLADDSGLCVDILGGAPGVWSSRYAGPAFMRGKSDGSKIPQDEQNRLLIEQTSGAVREYMSKNGAGSSGGTMRTAPAGGGPSGGSAQPCMIPAGGAAGLFKNGLRSCHYACSMVLFLEESRFFIAQETMEGALIERIEDARGDGGFGYDPIVILPQFGKTVAEISADEKNAISHRGKATRTVLSVLRNSFR